MKIGVFLLFGLVSTASAQVKTAWVASYPAGVDPRAVAVATDRQRNVYVVGVLRNGVRPYGDGYVVLKYSASGSLIWTYPSDPMRTPSHASALTLDAHGNVYVAGFSVNLGRAESEVTKLDPRGHLQWVARHAGDPANDFGEVAAALAVDEAGHVFVGGYEGNSRDVNFLTIKYDNQGRELWAETYNDAEPYHQNFISSLALDPSGNVVVTGTGIGAEGTFNYLTIKYSANGVLRWVTRYDSGGDDRASAVAIDRFGNVLVTGSADSDLVTVKYAPNGHQVWAGVYDGPVHGLDLGTSLAVDDFGNVTVAGVSTYLRIDQEDEAQGFITVKYSPNGRRLWVSRYHPEGGSTFGGSLALDSLGNAYVNGIACTASGCQLATVKYNWFGYRQWATETRFSGGANPGDLTVAPDGNIHVVGSRIASPESELVTITYTQTRHVEGLPRLFGPVPIRTTDSDVSLRAHATGLSPIWYQWRMNGVAIPEGTNATYVVRNVGDTTPAEYSVEASNALGATASPEIRIGPPAQP